MPVATNGNDEVFVSAIARFQGVHLSLSRPWKAIYKIWDGLDRRIGYYGTGIAAAVLAVHEVLSQLTSTKLLGPVSGMDPEVLRRADIYHSPFYPFDRQVRAAGHVKKFLMVHDLIPVLFPRFFKSRGAGILEEAFRGIAS